MMQDLRILVVDDSAIYRQTIINSLRDVDGVQVVGTAKNGIEAIEKIVKLDPDAVQDVLNPKTLQVRFELPCIQPR